MAVCDISIWLPEQIARLRRVKTHTIVDGIVDDTGPRYRAHQPALAGFAVG